MCSCHRLPGSCDEGPHSIHAGILRARHSVRGTDSVTAGWTPEYQSEWPHYILRNEAMDQLGCLVCWTIKFLLFPTLGGGGRSSVGGAQANIIPPSQNLCLWGRRGPQVIWEVSLGFLTISSVRGGTGKNRDMVWICINVSAERWKC